VVSAKAFVRDGGHDAVVACCSGIEYGERSVIFGDGHGDCVTMCNWRLAIGSMFNVMWC
jgi:hypothetical protein